MTRVYHKNDGVNSWCCACRQLKPRAEFGIWRKSHNGLVEVCKVCRGRYQKDYLHDYYLRNRDTLLPKHRITARLSLERKRNENT